MCPPLSCAQCTRFSSRMSTTEPALEYIALSETIFRHQKKINSCAFCYKFNVKYIYFFMLVYKWWPPRVPFSFPKDSTLWVMRYSYESANEFIYERDKGKMANLRVELGQEASAVSICLLIVHLRTLSRCQPFPSRQTRSSKEFREEIRWPKDTTHEAR